MVEDGQRQRLQDHRRAECSGDGQHRRTREVQLALPVTLDVAVEGVAGQVVDRPTVENGLQAGDLGVAEAEAGDRVDQPAGAGDDPVPPPRWQSPGEHLERTRPVGGPVGQRRLQHRQLVVVGEQRGRPRGRLAAGSPGRSGTWSCHRASLWRVPAPASRPAERPRHYPCRNGCGGRAAADSGRRHQFTDEGSPPQDDPQHRRTADAGGGRARDGAGRVRHRDAGHVRHGISSPSTSSELSLAPSPRRRPPPSTAVRHPRRRRLRNGRQRRPGPPAPARAPRPRRRRRPPRRPRRASWWPVPAVRTPIRRPAQGEVRDAGDDRGRAAAPGDHRAGPRGRRGSDGLLPDAGRPAALHPGRRHRHLPHGDPARAGGRPVLQLPGVLGAAAGAAGHRADRLRRLHHRQQPHAGSGHRRPEPHPGRPGRRRSGARRLLPQPSRTARTR